MKTFIIEYQDGWERDSVEVKAKDYHEARQKAYNLKGNDITIRDVTEKKD
jgi:hypothetical protein